MCNQLNLEDLSREISNNLLDTKYLLEILENMADGDAKMLTVLRIAKYKNKLSFKNIEKCRHYISNNN